MKKAMLFLATVTLSLCFGAALAANTLVLPRAVTTIKAQAFYGDTSIDKVVLPEGCRRIEAGAFAGSSVTKVNLPYSISFIAKDAFDNCSSDLVFTVVADSYAMDWCKAEGYTYKVFVEPTPAEYFEYNITDDGVVVTGYKGNTNDVVVPQSIGGLPVVAIGDGAFANSSLTSIELPDGVTRIGNSVFKECDSLTSIVLPNSVTIINDAAFYNCKSLSGVILPKDMVYLGYSTFSGCSSLISISIPEGVACINNCTFANCTQLASVNLPDAITSIGYEAFENCTSLTSIDLPDRLISIDDRAFCGCTKLSSITIPNGVTSIGNRALSGCSFTSITLPDGVDSIGGYAFAECDKLESINIPDGVSMIDYGTFSGCSRLSSITIPEGITSIGDDAFFNCTSLLNVTLPDSLECIGEWAFCQCYSLMGITLPEGVTSIGKNAFYACEGMRGNLVIPDSVNSLGEGAFVGCGFDGNLILPDSLTTLSNGVFLLCSSLTGSLELPLQLQTIGAYAFDSCKGFSGGLIIPSSVTSIQSEAFEGCSGLNGNVILPNQLSSIPENCFAGCTNIKAVYGYGVTSIGDNAFLDCDNLKSINLSANLPDTSAYYNDSRVRYLDEETHTFLDITGTATVYKPEVTLRAESITPNSYEGKLAYKVTLDISYPDVDFIAMYCDGIEVNTETVENPMVFVKTPDSVACNLIPNEYQTQNVVYDADNNTGFLFGGTNAYGSSFNFVVELWNKDDSVVGLTADIDLMFRSTSGHTAESVHIPLRLPRIYDTGVTAGACEFSNEYLDVKDDMRIFDTFVLNNGGLRIGGSLLIENGSRLVINNGELIVSGGIIVDNGSLVLNSASVDAGITVNSKGALDIHGGTCAIGDFVFKSGVDHTGKIDSCTISVYGDAEIGEQFVVGSGVIFNFCGGTLDISSKARLSEVHIGTDLTRLSITRAFSCDSLSFTRNALYRMSQDASDIAEALKRCMNIQSIEQAEKKASNLYTIHVGYLQPLTGISQSQKNKWLSTVKKALDLYTVDILAENSEYKISTLQSLLSILQQTSKTKSYTVDGFEVRIKPIGGLSFTSTVASTGIIDLYEGTRKVMDFVYAPSKEGAQIAIQEYMTIAQEDLYTVFKKEFNAALTDGLPGSKYLNTILGMYEDNLFSEEKLKQTIKDHASDAVEQAVLDRLPNFKKFLKVYKLYSRAFEGLRKDYDPLFDGAGDMQTFINELMSITY